MKDHSVSSSPLTSIYTELQWDYRGEEVDDFSRAMIIFTLTHHFASNVHFTFNHQDRSGWGMSELWYPNAR